MKVRFPIVSQEFFININIPTALWPWGRRSLWQKSVPRIFPGGRIGCQCPGLVTLPPSYTNCHEIWQPQTPGTPKACRGLYRSCFTLPSLGLPRVGLPYILATVIVSVSSRVDFPWILPIVVVCFSRSIAFHACCSEFSVLKLQRLIITLFL